MWKTAQEQVQTWQLTRQSGIWWVPPEGVLFRVWFPEDVEANDWKKGSTLCKHILVISRSISSFNMIMVWCSAPTYAWVRRWLWQQGGSGGWGGWQDNRPAECTWREPTPDHQTPTWSQNHRASSPWWSGWPPVDTKTHRVTSDLVLTTDFTM